MMRLAAGAGAALLLAGCASALGEPAGSLAGVQLVRAAGIKAIALGRFDADPALPPRADRALDIRAAALKPPSGSTFSAYLGATLAAQLRAAGALDPRAPTVVSGRLVENRISAGFGTGRAAVAARFTVLRDGKPLYAKRLAVEARWTSNVIGAVAFMEAEGRYSGLYDELVGKLLADPDFQDAVAGTGAR